ncbi:MAG: dihydrolipoamide acetyltransferase family protein [Spirochaetota bacterium]
MAVEIKMPPLSQTTDTVRILQWLVKVGDTVKKGDPLCEVETDKVTMEVESFASGTILEIFPKAGEEVAVDSVIAMLGEEGQEPEDIGRKIKVTEMVRRYAEKHGVPLEQVRGTGPQGLMTRSDVQARLQEAAGSREVQAISKPAAKVDFSELKTRELKPSGNQQTIALNLSKSKREIPHYYIKITVIAEPMLKWRATHVRKDGGKVSVYSFFVYTAARAIREFPGVNGFYQDGKHYIYEAVNIGCAIASGEALYVPVIREADTKSIEEIDTELTQLTARARDHRLERFDIAGATFTLSNLGVYPLDEFSAIITPGQAGIVALGSIQKRVIIDNTLTMRFPDALTVTGSFDHRIVNGAYAAQFLSRLKEVLEKEL